ncbi:hypothetical protein [Mycolicibacterium brumae]|uniref:Uncharacterized protein n=1 Tax=Mycolicibacterium brumae TaxID=85968 RepID=A0A2G5PBJ0_9MYCO|nr:hypothetical protein [Mycolicibacterium brumae]MCV7191481.1 hypothetical protein [Mycolicibacterium brumae]PIB75711.1 hypothetical protein CQY22_008200 [Mycolicibacterium brumae]RWA16194.1 hypothetical protein MBRU_08790 [Mycolicibacterium brumae DSM 44177]UWW09412.1 hypothetical protein L2Z93_002509 [Mycolicibacterium brumae]
MSQSNGRLTVWCENSAHPKKHRRVLLARFVRHEDGWQQLDGRGTVSKLRAAGTVPDDRWDMRQHRIRGCRYCADPLTVRTAKLDAVLDLVADTGRADVTVSELRAILAKSRTM